MKKVIGIFLIFCLLIGGAGVIHYKRPVPLPAFKKNEQLWVSSRPLPENIAMDAYLSGNVARTDHDLERAAKSYLRVLEKDAQNVSLWEDTYLLAMIQGVPEIITPHLDKIKTTKLLIDYARVVAAFQGGDLDKALKALPPKNTHAVDTLLTPLIRAWIYAKQGHKKQALAQIDALTKTPFVSGYHKVLLGTYFDDADLVQKGIIQMGDNSIPAIGYFPLLKKVITETGNWDMSALKKKYQEIETNYPVTADLLVQIGQTEITAEKGLAETLYVVSALGGNGTLTREEALALNSLALFLQPDKQMSLVWGAELSEGLRLPKVALSYYHRLTFHSATLTFKEASALMSLGKFELALEMLEQLEKTNKTSIPLLTLLGQAYQEQNENEKALAVYNRLIPLLEASPKNDPLIQAYMIRGILYAHQDDEQMLADLKRAQRLDPENAMLLNDLGYHQLESGEVDEGFNLVQKAHEKRPNDPYILDSLAFGYWKKGQASMALPFAEHALDLMPQSALINAHLGDIYASLGRHREAGFQYKKALDLKTDLNATQIQELNTKLKSTLR